MEAEIQIKLSTEFQQLRQAFNDPAKYVTIAAGRRSGKTYEATNWLLHNLISTDAKNALWVDTKHSNIDKYVDRYFRDRLDTAWQYCNYNQQKKILTLFNGKYIDFGSAERPENLEGFEYDIMIVNEAGICLKKASLWDNTLQPMTRGRNKTRFVGTPKGKNKFFELTKMGGDHGDYKSYHFPAHKSPYWTDKELDSVERQVPLRVWQQEYLATFVEGEGQVFRNIHECIEGEHQESGKPGVDYVMGVDLAKHQDYTVVMVAEADTKRVVFMNRFQGTWTVQKGKIFSIAKRFGNAKTLIDSTGVGDSIYDDLRAGGMNLDGYKFTSVSKQQLIENLIVALDNKQITYPHYETLIDELELYEYNITKSGNVTYNAPEGFHDDTVIALALVNNLLKNNVTVELIFV